MCEPTSSPWWCSLLADPGTWGHENFRHIAAELNEEYTVREGDTLEQPEGANNSAESDVKLPGTVEDLRGLAKQCARFFLDHNAEPDAVNLLEELEIINEITRLVDENMDVYVSIWFSNIGMYFISLSFVKFTIY